jgi:choline kinase
MSIAHAIILAAGQGSRLLPLTVGMPKCLIEVGGKTILGHQLDALLSVGVESFTIVTGYRAGQIEREAYHLARQGMKIETLFNPFWAAASSIGSVWIARERLRQPFLLLNGDTIFDPALLSGALDGCKPGLSLLVEAVAAPEEDDMRVVVSGGVVRRVAKGLPLHEARHRSLGVIASSSPDGRVYLDALDQELRSGTGVQSFHHAVIDEIARTESVCAAEVGNGFWQEIDRPEDIDRWNELHKKSD